MYTRDVNNDIALKNNYFDEILSSFIKVKGDLENKDLKSILSLETKDALSEKCRVYQIKGYSKLKKDEISSLVASHILNNIDELMSVLSYKEVNFLNRIIKSDTTIYSFNISELHTVDALCTMGFIEKVNVNSEYHLIIGSDLIQAITPLISKEELLDELSHLAPYYDLIDGLLIKYGVLPYETFAEEINSYSEDLDEYTQETLLSYILRSYEFFQDGNYILHPFVMDPFFIENELKLREVIPYDFSSKEELMTLGRDFSLNLTNEAVILGSKLCQLGVKPEAIDNLLKETDFYIKNDLSFQLIMDLVIAYGANIKTEAQVKEYQDAFIDMYHNTNMWVLKGYTPTEIKARRTTYVKEEVTVGRNEPCPCNSGKKYKKCCGK